MLLKKTKSICPECYEVLDADIVEEKGKVFLKKSCKEHGDFSEVYWSDAGLYKWADKFGHDGLGIENPEVKKEKPVCPYDCGLCNIHKSNTALANLFITNRCNLRCWYCFANVGAAGKVFEPDLKTLDFMLKKLRAERPVATKAIQITGGEPTIREDLIEIIKMCRQNGFSHVQLNTNGLRLGNDPGLAKKCREAGVNTVYMSFDGTTKKTNKWLEENMLAIENCRKAGMGIVLVPVMINGVNNEEAGKIIKFAVKNIDIIRGVNFQPVSFVGKMPKNQRQKMRYTIPDLLKDIEKGTDGKIKVKDFYPIPCVVPISKLVGALTGKPQLEMSCHQHCGTATYVIVENRDPHPITEYVDVDRFFKVVKKAAEDIKKRGKLAKAKWALKGLVELNKIVKKNPKGFNIKRMLFKMLVFHDYKTLGEFHYKTLFIGTMHFQDPYNYDLERVKRCVIHYAMPDGRIVPFCAFNGLPHLYLTKMQQDYGIPIKDWEKKTGRKLSNDLYKKV